MAIVDLVCFRFVLGLDHAPSGAHSGDRSQRQPCARPAGTRLIHYLCFDVLLMSQLMVVGAREAVVVGQRVGMREEAGEWYKRRRRGGP